MNDYTTRKGKKIKQIKHPSLGQLCLILVPWLVCMTVGLIMKRDFPWVDWVGMASVVIMTVAVVYFCVRQKCYVQLAVALFTIISMAFICFGTDLIFDHYFGG